MKENKDFEVVASYTRKEAIADGVQVRIPDKIRKEAGIRWPVFVTDTVWDRYLKVPAGMRLQDMDGRIWDMLYMFVQNARRYSHSSKSQFKVIFQMPKDMLWERNEKRSGVSPYHREVTLIAEIGANDIDDPTPAITICTQHDS